MSESHTMPQLTAQSAHPPLPRPSFTLIPASPSRLEASIHSEEAPSESTLVQEPLPRTPQKALQTSLQSFDLDQQSYDSQDGTGSFQGLY
ncbi:hypothetical protein B0H65DRAFT_66420 [Neurospora tetraspora]|uniref:Uncharacterized protein n=1 Tax=Neurospora tetraspora TaxID=94610 RepID=A0AAE0JS89_9PEZI|nr:hypothetical protein B0H65DRAFT_66420 [Neurospora tetraspora]